MNVDDQAQDLRQAKERLEDALAAAALGVRIWDIQKDRLVADVHSAFFWVWTPVLLRKAHRSKL